MKKWSIRNAALLGLIVGLLGLAADLNRGNPDQGLERVIWVIGEVLTPAAFFGAVAWLQNRFAKG